tara:strand:- start:497 stop:1564 length:1068 start_codon:yes stop_codon:yes gene_type:complete
LIVNLFDLEKKFPEKLSEAIYDYYSSGARDEITLRRNISIFNNYEILPKLLRNVSSVNTSTSILGLKIGNPIMAAPLAMQSMAHADGEIATAKAMSSLDSIMTLPTSSNKSIEEVAPHSDKLFFQLYFAKDRKITEDILKRCYEKNYKAIVFTADAPRLGTREKDERNSFKMPENLTLANFKGTSFEKYDDYEGSSMSMHSDHLFDPTLTFEIIHWIKEKSKLPVLVKGILRPDDAAKCFENGADGIIISNHGGRQLDTAVPTLKQIRPIREEVGKDKLLIADGGIRRGTDILKCLALGANAVQIGRPILWGLAHDGQDGVELVLNILLRELVETMILTGCTNLNDISQDLITEI